MRISYLSHVDSRWIKQRPHFLTEALARIGDTSVTYICALFVSTQKLVKSQRLEVDVLRIPILPQRFREVLVCAERPLSWVSAWIIRLFARPDIVIVTHARHKVIAQRLAGWGVDVFYDCMDLNLLFDDSLVVDKRWESQLVRLSKGVFCSSTAIEEHIRSYGGERETHNVLNALNSSQLSRKTEIGPRSKVVGYVGTISKWFDFDAIFALLKSDPSVVIRLWGPSDVAIPSHHRLEYFGVVPHENAMNAMSECAALVMPFRLNDLVLAVDPVKIYEYIASGRPVIAPDYRQLQHFGSLIYRYSGTDDFVRKTLDALDSPPIDSKLIDDFVADNSWDERAAAIMRVVSDH